LCDVAPEISAAGAALVGIGNGTPAQAAALGAAARVPFPLYADPSRRSYRAAGLRRSWVRVLDPRVFLSARKARRTGARQVGIQGDPWQLGGVLVFDASGRLVWRQQSRFPGDHAAPADILQALRSAV